MKWYKHLVDSGDDPDIQDAISLFGSNGYYVFFRTLEIMGREFDEENPAISQFSLEYFSSRFRLNLKSILKVLEFFQDRGRFEIKFSDNKHFKEITIICPKLKDLTDEYTQKRLKQKSGQNPDSVGTKSRIEVEVEEEEEIDKKDLKHIAKFDKKTTSPDVKIFIDFYFKRFKEQFQKVPVIEGGKDGQIVKKLLMNIPLKNLESLLDKFFLSDDPFILQSGYTLGVFKSQVNKLNIHGEHSRAGPSGKNIESSKLWLKIQEEQDAAERQKEVPGGLIENKGVTPGTEPHN